MNGGDLPFFFRLVIGIIGQLAFSSLGRKTYSLLARAT